MIGEKEIRGYQLKNATYVCPVCVKGEEVKEPETKVIAEDEIHDTDSMMCIRCKKAIK
jgi:hypothetical protein